jgi:hypothetical protein
VVERVVVTSDGRTTTVACTCVTRCLFQSTTITAARRSTCQQALFRTAEAGSGRSSRAASGHDDEQQWRRAPRAPAPHRPDGVRFRWASSRWRRGVRVNFAFGMGGPRPDRRPGELFSGDQPYLAFGAGSIGSGVVGLTGTAGASLIVDFTFLDRLVVAVGGGYGILNNPHGPEIHVRLGGYPAMGFGENGYSRHGLVLAVDGRTFFLFSGPEVVPVMQVMGTIGYAAF